MCCSYHVNLMSEAGMHAYEFRRAPLSLHFLQNEKSLKILGKASRYIVTPWTHHKFQESEMVN